MAENDITPLIEFSTGTLPRGEVLLSLGLMLSEPAQHTSEEVAKVVKSLQVRMSASQADELALALQNSAEASRERAKSR